MEFPKKYNHREIESKWQADWQQKGVYHWRDDKPRDETFVIDTPPPTVSGILHMGHVFSYTQADFIARYKRMKGQDVFYPMGFDDNGLPTERLVEKVRKVRATDLPREEFIKVCEEVVDEAEKEFEALFNSLALSVDWRQKYMTISETSRKISQLSFLDLYNKGEVERRHQPMFWDPVDQTAIATAEMEEKELDSFENYLWFGLVDEQGNDKGKVEIMTTRPEMLPACVAVMCHPDDLAKYKGLKAVVPLFGQKVDIYPSEAVDKEKGTGVVMCCTFGDEQDINWWREHKLETKIILNRYGKLDLHNCYSSDGKVVSFPEKIRDEVNGLKAAAARTKIIEMLEQGGLTAKEKKPIKHMVKCAERSGAALEIIPTEQWFVKVVDKKERILAKINECNWFPKYMKLRAEQWTENLSWDWCISRQRYFGVPFPVWYGEEIEWDLKEVGRWEFLNNSITITASVNQLPVNPLVDIPDGFEVVPIEGDNLVKFMGMNEQGGAIHVPSFIGRRKLDGKLFAITSDKDVMDTWATSSVSPQLNSRYGIDAERHKKLFPADMRPQAHEIIRTWAFYTIVKAMLHEDTIPWNNLMISGWCLAEDKSKMSKSKGNVITPVPLIEEKSSDVVRYWASTANLGADTAYSEDVLKIGNKLVNKLWNVCKFASLNLTQLDGKADAAKCDEVLDKWILSRLKQTITNAEAEFEKFEYSRARQHIEDFFWNDFCDNYLEMVKTRSYGQETGGVGQQSALNAIAICVDNILRLWAPFVPHITEELHSIIFESAESIHARGSWPKLDFVVDEAALKCGEQSVKILDEVRKYKSEKEVSIKFPIKLLQVNAAAIVEQAKDDLRFVTSSQEIEFKESEEVKVNIELGEAEAA